MSSEHVQDLKDRGHSNDIPQTEVDENENITGEEKASDKNKETAMPSSQQEEEVIKKKYGGLVPKKHPLISKDHERAFFDSADWALGKQGGQKPKGPLEALRPKLQPTPHQQVRRSSYAPADEGKDAESNNTGSPGKEGEACAPEGDKNIDAEENKDVDPTQT